MKYLVYLLFRAFLFLFGMIPFRVLYIMSDFFRFILLYIYPYRKKVILTNLRSSFPEKSEAEIKSIYKKTIRNFCDIMLETAKSYTMKGKNLVPRFKVVNPEVNDEFFKQGRSILWTMSHYANWEWCSKALTHQLLHSITTFYKPMANPYINKFILDQRKDGVDKLFSVYETNKVYGNPEDTKPITAAFISDQSPVSMKKVVWVNFLNQITPCVAGMDMYAKRYNVPVIHMDIQRVKRGYYEVEFVLLCENPKEYPENGAITILFMKKLQEIIRKKPEDWLWSHRRWKHSDELPENAVVHNL